MASVCFPPDDFKDIGMTIKRLWHGWTTKENADEYQRILQNEVIPGIEAKNIAGMRKFEILRIELEDETEFVTIITFDSLQDVIAFQGEHYTKAYVPDAAKKVLKRWDLEIPHYELIEKAERLLDRMLELGYQFTNNEREHGFNMGKLALEVKAWEE